MLAFLHLNNYWCKTKLRVKMPNLEFGRERTDQVALYLMARTMAAQARGRTVLNLNTQQQETHRSLDFAEPDVFPRIDALLNEPKLSPALLSINQMAEALNVPTKAVLGEAYPLASYIRQSEGEDEVIASLSLNERRRFRRWDLVGSDYFPQVVRSRARRAKILEYLLENQPHTVQSEAA